MPNRISVPSLLLNNQLILIKPNSLKIFDGQGERTVSTQSGGNDTAERVYSLNAETLIGKVHFSVINTSENVNLVRSARQNMSANTLVIVFNDGSSESLSYTNMMVTNNPEYALSHDGEIAVEFEGDPPV